MCSLLGCRSPLPADLGSVVSTRRPERTHPGGEQERELDDRAVPHSRDAPIVQEAVDLVEGDNPNRGVDADREHHHDHGQISTSAGRYPPTRNHDGDEPRQPEPRDDRTLNPPP